MAERLEPARSFRPGEAWRRFPAHGYCPRAEGPSYAEGRLLFLRDRPEGFHCTKSGADVQEVRPRPRLHRDRHLGGWGGAQLVRQAAPGRVSSARRGGQLRHLHPQPALRDLVPSQLGKQGRTAALQEPGTPLGSTRAAGTPGAARQGRERIHPLLDPSGEGRLRGASPRLLRPQPPRAPRGPRTSTDRSASQHLATRRHPASPRLLQVLGGSRVPMPVSELRSVQADTPPVRSRGCRGVRLLGLAGVRPRQQLRGPAPRQLRPHRGEPPQAEDDRQVEPRRLQHFSDRCLPGRHVPFHCQPHLPQLAEALRQQQA